MTKKASRTGLTRDSGWQIGVRRTLPIEKVDLWEFLVSPAGMAIWLGQEIDLSFEPGGEYILEDGTRGEIRVVKPYSHWRMTRQPPDPAYERSSTVQVRVMESESKCVLAFHEEHLPSQLERQARKTFYLGVIELIQAELD